MLYGYARISTNKQNIERQVRNITAAYPDALIISEAYTGTKLDRPQWSRLYNKVKSGDTIIFDSVSRMSRNADEGYNVYMSLYERGISLVFLKEPMINTSVYADTLARAIPSTGTTVDLILNGVNDFLKELAREQIKLAFEQSEKEVDDLHKRTKEGIETARLNGKQIGRPSGEATKPTKKELAAREIIAKHSKDFGGTLSDAECITLCGCSRNSYYKYKSQMKQI